MQYVLECVLHVPHTHYDSATKTSISVSHQFQVLSSFEVVCRNWANVNETVEEGRICSSIKVRIPSGMGRSVFGVKKDLDLRMEALLLRKG